MAIDRRLLGGALSLSLMLVLAACGGAAASPTAPTGGDPTAAPTDAPDTTAAPTDMPDATAAPTDDGNGNGGDLLTDLARMLPETVSGVTFERTGFDGDELGIYGAAAGLSGDQLEPVLKAHGKTLNDVNFAIAAPTEGESMGMTWAIQIEGVPAKEVMDAMGFDTSGMTEATVAGKRVYTAGGGGFGQWIYPTGDIVFAILLATDEVAEGILGQLP